MEVFLGLIIACGYNFAPRDWAFCWGQLLSISSNTALYSLLGTNFGGDGRTTFGLPDLRGRTIVGAGTAQGLSPIYVGQIGGREIIDTTPQFNYSFTLTEAQMPAHSHTATLHGEAGIGDKPGPANKMLAGGTNIYKLPDPADNKVMASESIVVDNAGSGQAVTGTATGTRITFDNRGPYLGLNYIISLQGLYPTRS